MRTKLILNPKANKGRSERHFSAILDRLADDGMTFDEVRTTSAGHARDLAAEAVRRGYQRIISVGGDGTLYEVVNGILSVDGDPLLGIVPVGTCNDFVKAVGIPASIAGACDILRDLSVRKVDVTRVGDRYSINAFGIGFDVAVVQSIKKSRYTHGFLMYLTAVLHHIFRFKGLQLSLVNGSEHFERNTMMLTVANGTCYGGNFNIAPHADVSDGLLNAVLLRDVRPWKRLIVLPRFIRGTHLDLPEVEAFLTSELVISGKAPFTLQMEGELVPWPSNRVEVKVLPQRLRVIVPG